MNNFSNRLELLIKENKTKKKDLAAAIGMAPSSITDMVKGRNNSTTPVIRAIAGYYHVNPDWLETGAGEVMEPDERFAVTQLFDQISPAEAEALRIMRECPEALAVVRMMGDMDSDTQKDIQRIAEKEKRLQDLIREQENKKTA